MEHQYDCVYYMEKFTMSDYTVYCKIKKKSWNTYKNNSRNFVN